MNKFLTFILFFIFSISFGQDLTAVDQKVLNYSEISDIVVLSQKIDSDFNTELEKVRAIYTWIANNVAYSYLEIKPSTGIEDSVLAKNTVVKKRAICHGYSILFKEICKLLKIESRQVVGFAKNSISDIGLNLKSNHAWNIVVVEKKEYLIDVTWAAGYYKRGKFTKEISYAYFLAKPEILIKSHYPDDYEDSLLNKKIARATFNNWPRTYIRRADSIVLKKPIKGRVGKRHNTKFIYQTKKEVKRVSYSVGDKFFQVKDFEIENDSLTFFTKSHKYKSKKLIIFINGKAINGFKILY